MDTPSDEVERRDSKGLYAALRAGRARDVPGADLVYEPPARADVIAHGGRDDAALARLLQLLGRSTARD